MQDIFGPALDSFYHYWLVTMPDFCREPSLSMIFNKKKKFS